MRDPRGFQIIQELPAPPFDWIGTPWYQSTVNFVGGSVFYLGANSKGAFNLLPEAIEDRFSDFQKGFFDCLCAQGSWDIAFQLARRTCVCANIQLTPGMHMELLCALLDTIENDSIDESVIVCWQGNDLTCRHLKKPRALELARIFGDGQVAVHCGIAAYLPKSTIFGS